MLKGELYFETCSAEWAFKQVSERRTPMNKAILSMVLAISFAAPLEAAPLAVPAAPSNVVKVQDWQRDGDWRRYEGRREWRRSMRGNNRWRMRQARRDCYRYGDCRRWERMQRRGYYQRRYYRNYDD